MRIVILGSGRGSNALRLLELEQDKKLGKAKIVGIVSDQKKAGILEHAGNFSKRACFVDPGKFKTKFTPESEEMYINVIKKMEPDLIVLAGFMRVIGKKFIDAFDGQIINLHPSLLPSFPGLHAVKQAFEAGVKVTGCTVHWVSPEIDAGPILEQASVKIEKDDDLESLTQKVHEAEHKLLPSVIKKLSKAGQK